MSTIALNSGMARACVILSLPVCLAAFGAARPAGSRPASSNRTSAYAEAGLNDPCVAGQTHTETAVSSGTSVSLAELLNRTQNQAKAPKPSAPKGGSLSRDLWATRVAAPEATKDVETSLALRRLIRQVRSVKFEGKETGPTFTAPVEEPEPVIETPVVEPVSVVARQPAAPALGGAAPVASASSASLPAKAPKTLDVLQQNPGQVRDPLEMAELLFLSGRTAEAAPFYAKALDAISPTDPSGSADRAWVLFQLGNCLRDTNTAGAQEAYMKLVSDYPTSPWTELAKAHGRLLTWYQMSRAEQVATPQL